VETVFSKDYDPGFFIKESSRCGSIYRMNNDEINLWHYTTLTGLKGIISDQCLRATSYRYLNDGSEIIYSKSVIHQEILPKIIAMLEKECCKNPNWQTTFDAHGGVENFAELEIQDTLKILYAPICSEDPIAIPCVLSFCKTLRNALIQKNGLLSQWRGYGKDGGYALVFNMEKLCKEFSDEEEQFDYFGSNSGGVVYVSECPIEDKRIKKHIDDVVCFTERFYRWRVYGGPKEIFSPDTLFGLLECMMLIKHIGFSEEKEYRFYAGVPLKNDPNVKVTKDKKQVLFRESAKGLVPYIELFKRSKRLPIEAVCVGPHKDKELRAQSVRDYLRIHGYGDTEVYCSDIPFIG
jgi:hypothetical protein